MKSRPVLAAMVMLGACKTDHDIGAVAQDSGPDVVDTQDTVSLATADTSSVSFADTQTAYGPEVVAETQTPPNNGSDGGSGALGPVQSWTGYVENYQFPSGSDAIKLSFATDSAGNVAGHVVLGNGVPPPPATDPNVGYPPGEQMFSLGDRPMEGFVYSIVAGTLASNRLRFAYDDVEPWAGWCALQSPPSDGSGLCLPNAASTAIPDSNGVYTCFLNEVSSETVVDCGKLSLCLQWQTCSCAAAGCTASYTDGGTTRFDMFVAGDTASGSVDGLSGGNVHFTRDP